MCACVRVDVLLYLNEDKILAAKISVSVDMWTRVWLNLCVRATVFVCVWRMYSPEYALVCLRDYVCVSVDVKFSVLSKS